MMGAPFRFRVQIKETLRAISPHRARQPCQTHRCQRVGVRAEDDDHRLDPVALGVPVGFALGVQTHQCMDGLAARGVNGGNLQWELCQARQLFARVSRVIFQHKIASRGDRLLATMGELVLLPWVRVEVAIDRIDEKPHTVLSPIRQGLRKSILALAVEGKLVPQP